MGRLQCALVYKRAAQRFVLQSRRLHQDMRTHQSSDSLQIAVPLSMPGCHALAIQCHFDAWLAGLELNKHCRLTSGSETSVGYAHAGTHLVPQVQVDGFIPGRPVYAAICKNDAYFPSHALHLQSRNTASLVCSSTPVSQQALALSPWL